MAGEAIDYGLEVERRGADPPGERGEVEIKAGSGEHLALAIERRVRPTLTWRKQTKKVLNSRIGFRRRVVTGLMAPHSP